MGTSSLPSWSARPFFHFPPSLPGGRASMGVTNLHGGCRCVTRRRCNATAYIQHYAALHLARSAQVTLQREPVGTPYSKGSGGAGGFVLDHPTRGGVPVVIWTWPVKRRALSTALHPRGFVGQLPRFTPHDVMEPQPQAPSPETPTSRRISASCTAQPTIADPRIKIRTRPDPWRGRE